MPLWRMQIHGDFIFFRGGQILFHLDREVMAKNGSNKLF